MPIEHFHLKLDKEYLEKMTAFFLYRSDETEAKQPVISGVYIQRNHFPGQAPEIIDIDLEWSLPGK